MRSVHVERWSRQPQSIQKGLCRYMNTGAGFAPCADPAAANRKRSRTRRCNPDELSVVGIRGEANGLNQKDDGLLMWASMPTRETGGGGAKGAARARTIVHA